MLLLPADLIEPAVYDLTLAYIPQAGCEWSIPSSACISCIGVEIDPHPEQDGMEMITFHFCGTQPGEETLRFCYTPGKEAARLIYVRVDDDLAITFEADTAQHPSSN